MARNFNATTSDNVDLGDISTARFEQLVAWSFLAFFRVENTAGDDRAIVSKWDQGSDANNLNILLRTDAQTAPANLELFTGALSVINGGDNVELDTWYLTAVTNTGGGGGTDLKLYLLEMDGTVLDNGVSGSHNGNGGNTRNVGLGVQQMVGTPTGDPMDGDIAHVCYVDAALTLNEIKDYLINPSKAALRLASIHGIQYYLPMGLGSPDWDASGNGNTGTVSGTTISEGPPVIEYPSWSASVPYEVAAAGGLSIPIAAYHYNHNIGSNV